MLTNTGESGAAKVGVPCRGVSVFVLPGPRIRTEDANAVESLVRLELEAGVGNIVLDFSRVGWVSSYFLGSLVELHRKAEAYGVTITFCCLPEKVGQQIRLMRLDQFFTIATTVEKALGEGSHG